MFGKVFKEPKVLLSEGEKIMSLKEPKKKMSKTDDPKGCIFLFDEPKEIEKKIMGAVTDLEKEIKYDPIKKPGISNLLKIYSIFSEKKIEEIEKKYEGKGYEEFKRDLAKILILKLEVFRRKKKELEKRKVYLKEILKKGTEKAQKIAKLTIKEVREKMGLEI